MADGSQLSEQSYADNGKEPEKDRRKKLRRGDRQTRFLAQSVILEEGGSSGLIRGAMLTFCIVIMLFIGWSMVTNVDEVAVTSGEVVPSGQLQSLQHLEGGIVKQILVQDGDHVAAGQPLLILDDTQAQAQVEIANNQYVALKAKEARLLAERDSLDEVTFPEALSTSDKYVKEETEAQYRIFQARKSALEGSVSVLEQRIEQLQSKLVGLNALRESNRELVASYEEELVDVEELLSQGFSDKIRQRDILRRLESYKGEVADLTATISSTEVQIGETRLQIIQLEREFQNQVVNDLSETQTRLKDVNERVNALTAILSRTVIKSPVDGILNGMQVHTVGGVIGSGTTIAEVVPQSAELIVEAQVSIVDIDRVSQGQTATIRFSSFGNRTPTMFGKVLSVSANAIQNRDSGQSYYLARIEVTPESLESLGDLVLVPGMPAEVLISTGSRTMLQYLFKPFSNAIARSFIED